MPFAANGARFLPFCKALTARQLQKGRQKRAMKSATFGENSLEIFLQ